MELVTKPYKLDQVKKLYNLIGLNPEKQKHVNIFNKITELGVISGSSVAYSLNDFIPKDTIGDVDIFVLDGNEKKFKEIIRLLSNFYANFISNEFLLDFMIKDIGNIVASYMNNSKIIDMDKFDGSKFREEHKKDIYAHEGDSQLYENTDKLTNNIPCLNYEVFVAFDKPSILNITFLDKYNIQLILSPFKTIEGVFTSFDSEYIQCAFHKQNLVITKNTQQSHITRVTKLLKVPVKKNRLLKVFEKGFQLKENCLFHTSGNDYTITKKNCIANPYDTEFTSMQMDTHGNRICAYTGEILPKKKIIHKNKNFYLKNLFTNRFNFYHDENDNKENNQNVQENIQCGIHQQNVQNNNVVETDYVFFNICPKEKHIQTSKIEIEGGYVTNKYYYLECEVKEDFFKKYDESDENCSTQRENNFVSFKIDKNEYNKIVFNKWYLADVHIYFWNSKNDKEKEILCPQIDMIYPLNHEPFPTFQTKNLIVDTRM